MSDKNIKKIIELLEGIDRLIPKMTGIGGISRLKEYLCKTEGISENGAYLLIKYVQQNVNI